jgi:putative YhdH/YhfP family quinone oxidoreductase
MVVTETPEGTFSRGIASRQLSDLGNGNVLIRVHYSSLNYKDALSATGNKGVTKRYPHTPGVDASGIVEESDNPEYQPGDKVIVTGQELGANRDGGFAEYVRVPAEWIVRLPERLSLRESMMYGTAGYTAGVSVHKLLAHQVVPEKGPVLVTGATGGVGCIAVALLAKLGFHVVAMTGKTESRGFLQKLGAKEVVDRDSVRDSSGKGLLQGRWAGVVDTVGGELLDSAIRQTKLEGAVAACGNVTSAELHTSVYPFILRGVSLLGINSAFTPMSLRKAVWRRLASDWKLENLDDLITEVSLSNLDPYIVEILKGNIRGRVLVNLIQ